MRCGNSILRGIDREYPLWGFPIDRDSGLGTIMLRSALFGTVARLTAACSCSPSAAAPAVSALGALRTDQRWPSAAHGTAAQYSSATTDRPRKSSVYNTHPPHCLRFPSGFGPNGAARHLSCTDDRCAPCTPLARLLDEPAEPTRELLEIIRKNGDISTAALWREVQVRTKLD